MFGIIDLDIIRQMPLHIYADWYKHDMAFVLPDNAQKMQLANLSRYVIMPHLKANAKPPELVALIPRGEDGKVIEVTEDNIKAMLHNLGAKVIDKSKAKKA